MGFVNISLVGWEAETVFCFRRVLGRVKLDSHCVSAPPSDVMGLLLRFRLLPPLLVTLVQMGLRVYCGSGAEGAWLVPLSSPGQKSHLRQRSIFEQPSKELVLISCSCSFQPATYKSRECERYFSHRRRLFKPEGNPSSPGSSKILRWQNCHEHFNLHLWHSPAFPTKMSTESKLSEAEFPATSGQWITSMGYPLHVQMLTIKTDVLSKHNCPFLLNQRQKKWLCLPFGNLDLAQGKWPAHFRITGC